MKFFFQKRNKDNNDDGQQPVPPQENQPVPPQENQPVPPQQPQYQPPQQPVPPQQPQYQPPQQPVPPQNYDPYAFQREQYKKQRNRRLIAQGLVALILLLAVFDGNPVNAFVDTTPVGEVIDSVKNRLNSVLGREGASSNNTSTQNGDTGSKDNSNENSPAGAAASEVSCDFDTTPYLSPFDGALGNNTLGANTDSPYFKSGADLVQLFSLVNSEDYEPDPLVTEDGFVDEFLELSSQNLVNHIVENINNLIVILQELDEQRNNDPNFQYMLELRKAYAELLKDELARFYIGNINDNEEVTKIKIFLNRNIISEFELKDIKQQPIFISYYDSSIYSNAIYSSDNLINEERIEETKFILGEKDGLFLSIDVEGIVGHNDFLNLAIQIGDNQGCWSEVYSVDTQYQSAYFLANEAIEEYEEILAAEEEAEEEDNNNGGGVLGSGPLITIPDISSINPGNLINPNILEGVELISDCSNDVLVPYVSGGTLNKNITYGYDLTFSDGEKIEIGYSLQNPDLYSLDGYSTPELPIAFTIEISDNCAFGDRFAEASDVEISTNPYINFITDNSQGGFSYASVNYGAISIKQPLEFKIWAERIAVESGSDCALYYDSANAAGKMINEFPFKVFETISPPADNVRVYSVIFEPLLASWCPGTFSIYYNIIDKSGNQTGKTYLTGFTFNFDESDITIVEK